MEIDKARNAIGRVGKVNDVVAASTRCPADRVVAIGTIVDHLLHARQLSALHFEQQDPVEIRLQTPYRKLTSQQTVDRRVLQTLHRIDQQMALTFLEHYLVAATLVAAVFARRVRRKQNQMVEIDRGGWICVSGRCREEHAH